MVVYSARSCRDYCGTRFDCLLACLQVNRPLEDSSLLVCNPGQCPGVFFVEANVCGSDECVSAFAVLYEQKKKSCAAHRFCLVAPPLIERLRRIYLSRAARKVPPFRRPSLSSVSDPAQSVKDGPRPDLTASRAQPHVFWSELEAEPRLKKKKKNVRSTPSGDGESVERGVRGLRSKDRFARARVSRVCVRQL